MVSCHMLGVMPISDAQIGRNLQRARGSITQKELAEAMNLRGWKWSQTTVHTIEQGKRPLRLSESEDVREILNYEASLTMDDESAQTVALLRQASEARVNLEKAIKAYLDAQYNMEMSGLKEGTSGTALIRQFASSSPEQLVNHVREKYGIESDQIDYEGIRNVKYSETP